MSLWLQAVTEDLASGHYAHLRRELRKTGHFGTFDGLLRARPSRFDFNIQQPWPVSRSGRKRGSRYFTA